MKPIWKRRLVIAGDWLVAALITLALPAFLALRLDLSLELSFLAGFAGGQGAALYLLQRGRLL